jgi:hypothetical protein
MQSTQSESLEAIENCLKQQLSTHSFDLETQMKDLSTSIEVEKHVFERT